MTDYPLQECAKAADRLVKAGATVYQKFTCQNCKARQTIDEPNRFYMSASCQECGHVTDITKSGCNYMVHASGDAQVAVLREMFRKEGK